MIDMNDENNYLWKGSNRVINIIKNVTPSKVGLTATSKQISPIKEG